MQFEKLRSNLRSQGRDSIIVWPKGPSGLRERLPVAANNIAKGSVLLPIMTAVLAAGIFAADTATNLEIAVPVLYVVVV
jgi:hypothetical protein